MTCPYANCDESCLECRVRRAVTPTDGTPIQPREALTALGSLLAEILAHVSDESATSYVAALMGTREDWKSHPRVVAQRSRGSVQ